MNNGEKSFTINGVRSGKLTDLTTIASGLHISGNIVKTDTASVIRATAQISTASARASEAAGDDDIAAE